MYATTLHRTKTDLGVSDTPSTTASPAGAFTQPDASRLLLTFEQATNAAPLVQLADTLGTTATLTVQLARAGHVSNMVAVNNHELLVPLDVLVPPGFDVYVYCSLLTNPAAGAERLNIFATPYTP